jgi:hypothetical protein
LNILDGPLVAARDDLIADAKGLSEQQQDTGEKVLQDVAKCNPIATLLMPSTWMTSPGWNVGSATDKATNRPMKSTTPWANRPTARPALRWERRRVSVSRATMRFTMADTRSATPNTASATNALGMAAMRPSTTARAE